MCVCARARTSTAECAPNKTGVDTDVRTQVIGQLTSAQQHNAHHQVRQRRQQTRL
jgi:hypothetical protein